jgi:hypothetical protein
MSNTNPNSDLSNVSAPGLGETNMTDPSTGSAGGESAQIEEQQLQSPGSAPDA